MADAGDDFGGFDPFPPATPMGEGFRFGYSVCELLFFGTPGMEPPDGFDPHTTVNPFADGTDPHRGFEEAFYDFTQK